MPSLRQSNSSSPFEVLLFLSPMWECFGHHGTQTRTANLWLQLSRRSCFAHGSSTNIGVSQPLNFFYLCYHVRDVLVHELTLPLTGGYTRSLAQHKFPRFCSLCAKSKCPFFSLLNISYFTHSLLYSVFCRFSHFQILLILFYCRGLKEKSSDTTSSSSNSSSRLASILQSTTYRQQSVRESNHIQEMMEMLGSEEMCTYFLEHPCQSRGYPETSTAAHPPTRL